MKELLRDAGLLFMRVSLGAMMLTGHGWPKLVGFEQKAARFLDPFGVGSEASLVMAIGAEVGCSLLVMLGLGTRFAAIPLVITMLVAAFIAHADDPWSKKEFALVYLVPFLTLALTGPGRFSLDTLIQRRRLATSRARFATAALES